MRQVQAFVLAALVGMLPGALPADEPAKSAEREKPPWQRQLQGDDARRAEQWEQQREKHWEAGQFEAALETAKNLADLRRQVQGEKHWQAVDARWQVEVIRRLLKHDDATRQKYARAAAISRQALELEAKGEYAEAKRLQEEVLRLRREIVGEDYPGTAVSYNNLAHLLVFQGQYAESERLYRKALAICVQVLGEEHPFTGTTCSNLAYSLYGQGDYKAADPLFRQGLAIRRRVLGEEHADTAWSYGMLALNLDGQGKYAAAEPLYRKELTIFRRVLGDEQMATAAAFSSLGLNLTAQGNHAAAEPLFQQALAIHRQVLGEEHPETSSSYNNVAVNLSHQGRYAAAEPLYEHALAIARQRLGAEHPTTAVHCANLAANRVDQHKFASAQPLLREALTIRRKVLGEEHVLTAASTSALARNFQAQADYTAADPLYRKALAIDKKQLGEEHHATAADLHNLAANLNDQEKYADAEPLFRRSLALLRKSLGDDHPETAIGGSDLAANLHAQGKYAEAETVWTAAADGFARARLRVAGSGLERAAITGERSPLPALAAVLARNRKPRPAWQRFEESLARGTWDDLSARLRRTPDERDRQTALAQGLQRLDQLIERNLADPDTPEQKQARETLLGQRRKMQEELDDLRGQLEKKYGPVAAQVFDGATIQKALPPDAALVGWIDRPGKSAMADPNGEHWAVLLRARGEPAWERLRGSGPGGAWTQADTDLPAHLRRALQTARSDWQGLSRKLSEQRLQPLARHLAAHDGLPAARRLIILPAPAVAGVPVETLAPDFTISYAPSATLFAYLRQQPKRAGAGLLALADPVFDRPRDRIAPLPLPPGGLLLTVVVPGSSADGARLKAGDVLLRYAGTELKAAADLPPLIAAQAQNKEVGVTLWREGRTVERTVPGGKLGVVVASDPAPQALAERRKVDDLLARSRGAGEGPWPPLPGTRVEAEGLRRVCVSARTPFKLLADSDASEQALFDMVRSRELAQYRYLHLATHGTLDDRFPLSSAVILARDHLPDPLAQLLANEPVYDGRLTAEKVLRDWSLQTDLVTLSACQTALGKYERGEGFVGFSQALLIAGSRSVCLSLWKVDDAATALLMDRFYQNLLGQRDGLKAPLPKAQALAEAKEWLRTLSRDEALKQAAQLTQGVERGKGRPVQPLLPEVPAAADKGDRPYAHPYYWAAFVLIGDPD